VRWTILSWGRMFFLVLVTSQLSLSVSATDNSPSTPKVLPQSSDVLVLKRTVRRVVVDVVVHGPDGKPVQGLTEKDFSILEDGTRQRVMSFDAHRFDSASIAMPASAAPLPANVYVNVPAKPEKGALFVLLFDMVNTEDITDQLIARQQLMKFIAGKPSGTRFAIFVHAENLRLVQGFTEDKDQLYAALDPNNPKNHVPKAFLLANNFAHGSDQTVAMISVLTHIGDFLNGIPGRKNLIWVSAHFPVSIYARAGDPRDLQDDMRREFDALTRAQIAVYPLDVRGVVANPEGALTGGGPHMGVGGTAASNGPMMSGGSPAPATTPSSQGSPVTRGVGPVQGPESYSADNMMANDVAKETGGRAIFSDNDLSGALDEMVEDGSNYYTLTYSPTNPNYDGSLRNIRVDVKGKYQLSYRRFYYADDPDAPPVEHAKKNKQPEENLEASADQDQSKPLAASLQHGAPLVHQLIFKVRVHAVGGPTLATPEQMQELAEQKANSHGKKGTKSAKPVEVQVYDIYYVVVASQITKEPDGSIPLEFAAVAFDRDGFVVNGKFEKVKTSDSSNPFAAMQVAPPEEWQKSSQPIFRALQELVAPVTATSIRVAIRDTANDRIGALEIPLPLLAEPGTRSKASDAAITPSTTASPN
jgi:VWFA-related protein